MALVNPSTLYSAGNVVLHPEAHVQLYAQLRAKQEARDDAANQYFNELPNKINLAGVRQQDLQSDRGGIIPDIDAWRSNWVANKDAIKKGGAAQQQHLTQFQNIQRKIEQSKAAAKQDLELGKAKFEGKFDPDDEDFQVLHNMGTSIYDPQHYKKDGVSEYDFNDLSGAVPAFDANKQKQYWDTATQGVKPGKVYDNDNARLDKSTGKQFVPVSETYSPEQIKTIADNAGQLAANDRSARKSYSKLLNSLSPDDLMKMNMAYQKVYGSNKSIMNPQQLAQAEAIVKSSTPNKLGEEAITDQNAGFDLWKKKNAITSAQALQRTYINKGQQSGAQTTTGNAFDEFPDQRSKDGKVFKNGSVYGNDGSPYTSPNGTPDIVIPLDLVPSSVTTAAKSGGIDLSNSDGIKVSVKNGEISSIETPNNGVISRQNMENLQKKFNTEPLKAAQPQFGKKVNTTIAPSKAIKKTKSNPLGLDL